MSPIAARSRRRRLVKRDPQQRGGVVWFLPALIPVFFKLAAVVKAAVVAAKVAVTVAKVAKTAVTAIRVAKAIKMVNTARKALTAVRTVGRIAKKTMKPKKVHFKKVETALSTGEILVDQAKKMVKDSAESANQVLSKTNLPPVKANTVVARDIMPAAKKVTLPPMTLAPSIVDAGRKKKKNPPTVRRPRMFRDSYGRVRWTRLARDPPPPQQRPPTLMKRPNLSIPPRRGSQATMVASVPPRVETMTPAPVK